MSEKDKEEGVEGEEEDAKYPNLTQEMLDEIDECFEIFDKDKDNLIGYTTDLGTLLRWLKFNPTERELLELIK